MTRRPRPLARGIARTLVLSLVVTACGGDDEDVPTEVLTGRVAEGDRYMVSGYVSESGTGAPVGGAQVCLAEHEEVPCGTSTASGKYVLRLSPSWTKPRELALRVTASDYVPYAGMIHESPTFDRDGAKQGGFWPYTLFMLRGAALPELAKQPADRALVEIEVTYADSGAPEGAEAVLVPEAAKVLPSRSMRVPKDGRVLFANVPRGRFEVSVAGCTPKAELEGVWRARTRNRVAGLAIEGTVTRLALTCSERKPTSVKPPR